MSQDKENDQETKYQTFVSYLNKIAKSDSDLFILKPNSQLKTVKLENPPLDNEQGKRITNFLIEAEKRGSELYVRQADQKVKRVCLLDWFND